MRLTHLIHFYSLLPSNTLQTFVDAQQVSAHLSRTRINISLSKKLLCFDRAILRGSFTMYFGAGFFNVSCASVYCLWFDKNGIKLFLIYFIYAIRLGLAGNIGSNELHRVSYYHITFIVTAKCASYNYLNNNNCFFFNCRCSWKFECW